MAREQAQAPVGQLRVRLARFHHRLPQRSLELGENGDENDVNKTHHFSCGKGGLANRYGEHADSPHG